MGFSPLPLSLALRAFPRLHLCALLSCAVGCGASGKMPDPEDAAQAYLKAAEAGDVETLQAMMTERAAQEMSASDLRALLARDHEEFQARRRAFSGGVQRTGHAQFFFEDGTTATLSLESGEFRVESVGVVAARPRTPQDAVRSLREALASRDMSQLLETLSEDSAESLLDSLKRLEKSLEDMDSAIFDIREDRATIEFADGRVLTLRREANIWKVEEIE